MRSRVLLFVAMIVLACVQVTLPTFASSTRASAPQALTAEEQTRKAIYAAVLAASVRGAPEGRLVVSTTVISHRDRPRTTLIAFFGSAPAAVRDLAFSMNLRSGQPHDLRLLPTATRLVPRDEITAWFRPNRSNPWDGFREAWGVDRYEGLSNVVLTPDGRGALVYAEYFCGLLCAWGSYFWLERDDAGDWILGGKVPLWIS